MIQVATNPTYAVPRPAVSGDSVQRSNASSGERAAALTDQVELSDAARTQAGPSDPPIRDALVQRVRQEIADGTYLTDDKLNAVVNRLHKELFRN